MDERQLGYPACEQSTILYPYPGTSALERTFSLRASSPRGTGEGEGSGRSGELARRLKSTDHLKYKVLSLTLTDKILFETL